MFAPVKASSLLLLDLILASDLGFGLALVQLDCAGDGDSRFRLLKKYIGHDWEYLLDVSTGRCAIATHDK
jgi:hypothetical protein